MEDRTLPSTYTVDLATDDKPNDNGQADPKDAMKGDLRYCVDHASSNDKIVFDPAVFQNPTTIGLNAALAINNKNLTIDGSNNGKELGVTIEGNISGPTICRIFTITGTSNVEIDNLTLASAKADATDHDGNGGAIYDNAGSLTLTNDDFLQNVAADWGGAIFAANLTGPFNVTKCNFIGNIAGGNGGAIYTSSPGQNTVLNAAGFTNNVAGQNGGAIDAQDGLTTLLSLSGCTFEGNHTNQPTSAGGAICTIDSLKDSNSIYTNNYAQSLGGAISWESILDAAAQTSLSLSYDSFTTNKAQAGGALTITSASNIVTN